MWVIFIQLNNFDNFKWVDDLHFSAPTISVRGPTIDVRIWRLKSVPALKEYVFTCSRKSSLRYVWWFQVELKKTFGLHGYFSKIFQRCEGQPSPPVLAPRALVKLSFSLFTAKTLWCDCLSTKACQSEKYIYQNVIITWLTTYPTQISIHSKWYRLD